MHTRLEDESGSPAAGRGRAFSTRAIHAGLCADPTTGALLTPIHQTTTYRQVSVGHDKGHTYSRASNPTVSALEHNLGELESALPAVCTASGMGAVTTLFLSLAGAGTRVVCSDVVYGGTLRFLRHVLAGFGVETRFVDTSDARGLEVALQGKPAVVFVETPANPTLKLTDLAEASRLTHASGGLLIVDNTFLTPAHQDCFRLGADVVLHSTTKYIEGHNATLGGALLTRDPALRARFDYTRKSIGTIQSPFEAWLTLRGLKTLELRFERQAKSALAIARWLEEHSGVARVLYPFLESFPQYELARRQQRSGGGIVSFELRGGAEEGIALMNSLELWTLAENLGAAESLVTHPASMTHASMPPLERERLGITDGLVRLSVGLEGEDDLLQDLARALELVT